MENIELLKRVRCLSDPVGRRSVGRPKLRWLDDVVTDCRLLGQRNWRVVAVGQAEDGVRNMFYENKKQETTEIGTHFWLRRLRSFVVDSEVDSRDVSTEEVTLPRWLQHTWMVGGGPTSTEWIGTPKHDPALPALKGVIPTTCPAVWPSSLDPSFAFVSSYNDEVIR
ncbi:hypothetical protein AAG570_010499 [Ranatra chinensis]|uniref:Uncharacterized protein n=1 Tax=Ranatra chinensis TaxID=642074 RepID=A0ABD0YPW1_9HEMI